MQAHAHLDLMLYLGKYSWRLRPAPDMCLNIKCQLGRRGKGGTMLYCWSGGRGCLTLCASRSRTWHIPDFNERAARQNSHVRSAKYMHVQVADLIPATSHGTEDRTSQNPGRRACHRAALLA